MIELFISNNNDPYFNLALEEYLVYKYKTDNKILYLWQNKNTIVVGRNQNAYEQINLDETENDKVNVVRRNTGGGTVFHDLGNICFSLIEGLTEEKNFSIGGILQPVVDFLKSKKLNAYFCGKNDIKIDDYKISGNAELKTKDKILVHGTLLYDVDLTKIGKYLVVNNEKMKSKKIKSNVAVVKNIIDFLEIKEKSNNFLNEMIDFFKKISEISFMKENDIDLDYVKKLREEKYLSWDWNFGKSATFENSKSKYIENKGFVEIKLNTYEGKIKDIKIYGDFLGYVGTSELENKLTNVKLNREDLFNVLNHENINEIFGENFSPQDIVELIL